MKKQKNRKTENKKKENEEIRYNQILMNNLSKEKKIIIWKNEKRLMENYRKIHQWTNLAK